MTNAVANGVGDRFVRAVTTRNFPGIAACLSDDSQFRALVPRGLREATGAEQAAAYFQTWFGSADRFELLATSNNDIGDRLHLTWRLLVEKWGDTTIVEQHAFATLGEGRITRLDLVCSGFRPIGSPGPGSLPSPSEAVLTS